MSKLCNPTAKKTIKYVIQVFFIGSYDDEVSYNDEESAKKYLQNPNSREGWPRRLIRRTEEVIAERSTRQYFERKDGCDNQDY